MSLTKVTYSMINGAMVNVLDYGAVGDGITDNTAVFNTVFGMAGACVYIPNGTYRIAGVLNQIACGSIIGEDRYDTILQADGVANVLKIGLTSVTSNYFANFTIQGDSTPGACGIFLGYNDELTNLHQFERVYVTGFDGVGSVGIIVNNAVTSLFINCTSAYNYKGCVIYGDTTTQNFINCGFRWSTSLGLEIRKGYDLNFINCVFEYNGLEGVAIGEAGKPAVAINFDGCWFEGNQTIAGNDPTKFHLYAGNAAGASIQAAVRNCFFGVGPGTVQAIKCTGTSVKNFYIDQIYGNTFVADSVVIDNNAQAIITWKPEDDWPRNLVGNPTGTALFTIPQAIDFTPVLNNFSGTGVNTITGTYARSGDIVFGTIKIVSAGGTGLQANSNSYISGLVVPFTKTVTNTYKGTCSVSYYDGGATAPVSYGVGMVIATGAVNNEVPTIFTPTWAAAVGTFVITFQFLLAN